MHGVVGDPRDGLAFTRTGAPMPTGRRVASASRPLDPELTPLRLPPEMHPRLCIVVDTEEEFDWNRPFSRDARSTSAVADLWRAQQLFERLDVKPLYAMDEPIVATDAAVDLLGRRTDAGRCELGVQLHAWVCPPFDEQVTPHNSFQGNLPPELERAKLARLSARIAERTGHRPRIHKAGRYGYGWHTRDILIEQGFTLDMSAMPPFSLAGEGGPSFDRMTSAPAWLDKDALLMELPTTGAFLGLLSRAGPGLQGAVDSPLGQRLMLGGVLARGGVLERLRLSPEGHSLEDMKRLTRLCHAAGQRVFTLAFHSPSLKPGCTAYARDAAERDALLARVARYVSFFREQMNGCVNAPGDLAETLRHIEETGRDPAVGRGPVMALPAARRAAAPATATDATAPSEQPVEIFLEPIESPAQAAKLWQPLAERAPRSGFLGWPWIGTWLLHLPHQVRPMLLGARQGGQVVALGLIARRREQRHRMEMIQDRLHEAGDPVLDRIMLEHNDFLVAPEAPPDIRERLFDGLLSRPDAPDEIVARHLRPEALAALDRAAARHGRIRHDAHVRRHDFVDLNGLRLAGRDYLDLLGANTRAAIRRSERLYADGAPIVAEPAKDTAEALEVFESLVARHQARWAARGKQGAFGTKDLYLFHRMAVKAGVPRGEVDLLRVRAGDTVLGELYNIRRWGWICQYQSGLIPPADNRHKPGLVAHAAAVRHYAKEGADRYDFLVGDSRYKADLATAREDLFSLTVAPDREPFRLVAATRCGRDALARRAVRGRTLD